MRDGAGVPLHCYHMIELRGRIVPCRRRVGTARLTGADWFETTCPRCRKELHFPTPPDAA